MLQNVGTFGGYLPSLPKYALTHNVVHEDLLRNGHSPVFESYNEQDELEEALEGFRGAYADSTEDEEEVSESPRLECCVR